MTLRSNELFGMWQNTRMVVLTAVVAAMFVAVLLPFKGLVIIPGYTELRPASLVPLVCSLLFGPAAAWGSAIGNLVGDVLGGMFGLGSIFGMIGNFVLGYLPYKLIENLFRKNTSATNYPLSVIVGILAALACASVIAWGVDLLGLVPFAVLGVPIAVNNSVVALFYPLLFFLLHSRIKRMKLLYYQVIPSYQPRSGVWAQIVGPLLVIGGSAGALSCGILMAERAGAIKLAAAPFIAAIFAGCLML